MQFIKKLKRDGGYVTYLFSEHDADDLIIGDQVWSNGEEVDIYEGIDTDIIYDVIGMVDNKKEFMIQLANDYVL